MFSGRMSTSLFASNRGTAKVRRRDLLPSRSVVDVLSQIAVVWITKKLVRMLTQDEEQLVV
jgi:hypothetical protein